jgi:hypothetical protein
VWEEERKERVRELYIKRGQLEEEFEAWWEEGQKEGQRGRERLKERQRELRKMKKEVGRWREWQAQEGVSRQAQETSGQVQGTYIDDYEYNDDY